MKNIDREFAHFRAVGLEYREYLVSGTVAGISILVFFLIIPWQFTQFLNSQKEVQAIDARVRVLSANYDTLSGLAEKELDQKLSFTTSALPRSKSFEGILQAISQTGRVSGVRVGDYGFDVGEIDIGIEGKTSLLSSIVVHITLDGGVNGLLRFLTELEKQFPLSDVIEVQSSPASSRASIIFYYKPFPSAKFEKNVVVSALSKKEEQLINTLSTQTTQVTTPPATSSAR